jgi:hypothetical protein
MLSLLKVKAQPEFRESAASFGSLPLFGSCSRIARTLSALLSTITNSEATA